MRAGLAHPEHHLGVCPPQPAFQHPAQPWLSLNHDDGHPQHRREHGKWRHPAGCGHQQPQGVRNQRRPGQHGRDGVERWMRTIARERLPATAVRLLHALHQLQQGAHIQAVLLDTDHHLSQCRIHLRPCHTLKPAQRTGHLVSRPLMLLTAPTQSTHLNVRPARPGPHPPVPTVRTRVQQHAHRFDKPGRHARDHIAHRASPPLRRIGQRGSRRAGSRRGRSHGRGERGRNRLENHAQPGKRKPAPRWHRQLLLSLVLQQHPTRRDAVHANMSRTVTAPQASEKKSIAKTDKSHKIGPPVWTSRHTATSPSTTRAPDTERDRAPTFGAPPRSRARRACTPALADARRRAYRGPSPGMARDGGRDTRGGDHAAGLPRICRAGVNGTWAACTSLARRRPIWSASSRWSPRRTPSRAREPRSEEERQLTTGDGT